MGCSSSKLDDLPAVALCRERCTFLDEAIQRRFALAEAHVAYTASLKLFGQSLNNFIDHDFGASSGASPPFPPSPNKLKSKAVDQVAVGSSSPKKDAISHHHSHSNSGSHLHFHSESDEYDSGGSLHHSDHSSPLHDDGGGRIDYLHQNFPSYDVLENSSFPGGFMHMNFMKKQPTSSIVYEQRPTNPEIVYMGESSSSSSSYNTYSYVSSSNNNNNNNPSSSSYPHPDYQNYGGISNYSSYAAPGSESSLPPSSTAAGPDLCNVVHGIQILCMPAHVVAADTTFSCKVHSRQKHVFCIVFHGGKALSLSDNLGIGNKQNDIVMHAPKGQAFSSAAEPLAAWPLYSVHHVQPWMDDLLTYEDDQCLRPFGNRHCTHHNQGKLHSANLDQFQCPDDIHYTL